MKKITIKEGEIGRIDKVLSVLLKVSRTKVAKAIKADQVLVNGEVINARFEVEPGMKVGYDKSLTAPRKKTKFKAPKLNILFEDDDVIVVNKPAGLIVHATETSDEPTLVDGLIAYCKSIAKIGDQKERAGLVHRLDKATSGVLIVAKNQDAFEHLKNQFKERLTEKYYIALVRGKMEKDHDTIDFSIERSKTTGRMAAKPTSQGGKKAITHYEVLKRFPHHTLLDVKIETGRTHQIRAHMHALGHPVAGDTLYRQKGVRPMDIGRLFLHARELTITLPSGEEKTFSAPIPKELEEVLEQIPKI